MAFSEGEEGYTTAPEDDEVPPELLYTPPTRRVVLFQGGTALERSRSSVDAGYDPPRPPPKPLARSWTVSDRTRPSLFSESDRIRPALFSEMSFVPGPADESQLFGSPKKRISAWLSEHREELSKADIQRNRDLMLLLLENRSFGYPGTNGTLLSNYLAYCLNRHPLISIVTAHPLHPFTRSERTVVLTCSFCWAFMVKALMHTAPLTDKPWYVFYTVLALLVLPYEVLIRTFAVCSCVQYDDSEKGDRRRRAWLCCGKVVLGTLTAFNLGFLAYGVWTTVSVQRVKPYSLLRQSWSTIVVKLWALVVWFPAWLPVFLLFYNGHKQDWLAAHPPGHPCHVCATSTEDERASALYWLLVARKAGPPASPRVSKRFSSDAIPTLPLVNPARALRGPATRRAGADQPKRSAAGALVDVPRDGRGRRGQGSSTSSFNAGTGSLEMI